MRSLIVKSQKKLTILVGPVTCAELVEKCHVADLPLAKCWTKNLKNGLQDIAKK
jgi:hypothetical protein